MNITKDTILKNTKTYEAGFSVSETNIGLTITDKYNLKMMNAQFSKEETASIINFLAKAIGLKRYDKTVLRQAEKIEDLTNRNEDLRRTLQALTHSANHAFAAYEAGDILDAHTMLVLKQQAQNAEHLLDEQSK